MVRGGRCGQRGLFIMLKEGNFFEERMSSLVNVWVMEQLPHWGLAKQA